jgi:hypothetical protein
MVAIVALTVLSGQAWSEGSVVRVFSTGIKSCGEYLRAAEAERKARPVHLEVNAIYSIDYLDFASYADGYLTGVNMTQAGRAGQDTDLWGRMAWLEKYCRVWLGEEPADAPQLKALLAPYPSEEMGERLRNAANRLQL